MKGCLLGCGTAFLAFILVGGATWVAMLFDVPLWEIVPNGLGYIAGKDGAIQIAALAYGLFAAYVAFGIGAIIAERRQDKE